MRGKPSGHRPALLLAAAACTGASAFAAEVGPEPVLERIRVERVLLDLRVVDPRGDAILGLRPDDFHVRVDGRSARVDSVDWIDGVAAAIGSDAPSAVGSAAVERPARGRWIVLFVQRDLIASRAVGLMHLLEEARHLVRSLDPADRVALFSFDTHLELLADFTVDRARLLDLLREGVMPRRERVVLADQGFTVLGEHFDREAGRKAAHPETALRLVAEALEPLAGAKSLLYIGWGMGEMIGGAVQTRSEHGPMVRALARSRTAVFCLDVTRADFHSLEWPLMQAAHQSGGFYVRTYHFPERAMERVARAIRGHYELSFVKPALPAGTHRTEVRLVGREGNVYHRETYSD